LNLIKLQVAYPQFPSPDQGFIIHRWKSLGLGPDSRPTNNRLPAIPFFPDIFCTLAKPYPILIDSPYVSLSIAQFTAYCAKFAQNTNMPIITRGIKSTKIWIKW